MPAKSFFYGQFFNQQADDLEKIRQKDLKIEAIQAIIIDAKKRIYLSLYCQRY